ncbi:MAG TPA: VOC family protein [archaeon]|nr:VOC family protein [archaeon]
MDEKNQGTATKNVAKQIFVNLPVEDLDKSIAFFAKLGFTFNPEFTDKNATCMIIGENIFAMLLVMPFFKGFTKKEIPDAAKATEVIMAISVDSRSKPDEVAEKAIAAGAKGPYPPSDYGWMYSRSFLDLDGHMWEIFYMDESKKPKE